MSTNIFQTISWYFSHESFYFFGFHGGRKLTLLYILGSQFLAYKTQLFITFILSVSVIFYQKRQQFSQSCNSTTYNLHIRSNLPSIQSAVIRSYIQPNRLCPSWSFDQVDICTIIHIWTTTQRKYRNPTPLDDVRAQKWLIWSVGTFMNHINS